jgi:CubicO group peptidase (beta-lactamase class C family)
MIAWLRRSLFAVSAVGILGIGSFALWVLTPSGDHQPRRWYTLPFESFRAGVFTNWELIQPHAELRASSTPRTYARDLVDPAEVTYAFEGEHLPLGGYLDRANVAGLLVLAGGKVRLEFYGKGLDAGSRSHIWSASKSFTSTLVGMALHDGTLASLDDPVERYAPQFAGTAYGETSIRHVMMMSSGIDYFHFQGEPDRNDMYAAIMQEGEDFDGWAAALGRRVPPGTDFNYIATDTHVLSAVLRGAYGKPFVEIVQEKLWEPGGFGVAKWGLDHSGHAMGHCCLSLRLEDFAHLGQLYLEGLVLRGAPTVADDWIDSVERAQAPFQEPGVDAEGNPRPGYSFQFWLPPGYDQEFMAAGAFGQYLWIDRKRGFAVAQFSTGPPVWQMVGRGGRTGGGDDQAEFFAVMRALGSLAAR